MLALLVPAAALAQSSPTQTGYGESQVLNEVDRIPPPSGGPGFDDEERPLPGPDSDEDETIVPVNRESGGPPPAGTAELPFTGFDAGLIALMGLTLVGTGFVLRRSRGQQV